VAAATRERSVATALREHSRDVGPVVVPALRGGRPLLQGRWNRPLMAVPSAVVLLLIG
jgi:hypothetical protein